MKHKFGFGIIFLFFQLLFIPGVLASSGKNEETGVGQGISFISKIFTPENFLNFFFALGVLVLTMIIGKIINSKLNTYFESIIKDDVDNSKEGMVGVINSTITITIWVLGITLALGVLGVNIALFMGGIGFGIGFTLQIFLSNFIYGIIMVTQGTIRNGDLIEMNNQKTRVEKVTTLFTVVKRLDGIKMFIPNIDFLKFPVSNIYMNETRRMDLEITVDYTTDIPKMKMLIEKVLKNVPGILMDPAYKIWFKELDDRGVKLKVLFWVGSRDKVITIKSNFIETLNLAFKQAGIIVPFTQITLMNREDTVSEKYKSL